MTKVFLFFFFVLFFQLPSDLNALLKCLVNQQDLKQLPRAANITEIDDKEMNSIPSLSPITEESLNLDGAGNGNSSITKIKPYHDAIASVSKTKSSYLEPSTKLSNKVKCSIDQLVSTPNKRMKTRKESKMSFSYENCSNGYSSDVSEIEMVPSECLEQPVTEVSPASDFFSVASPSADPFPSFSQEEITFDFENEPFRTFGSLQPSFSEIKNWGYPTDEKNVSNSSSMSEAKAAVQF